MKRWQFLLILIGVILVVFYIFFTVIQNGERGDMRTVRLYFSGDNAMYLEVEERAVAAGDLYKNTLEALITGPETTALGRTIPSSTRILGIQIESGTAKVNFNSEFRENHWGGSTGERMTVYSIVNTLCQFSEIDRVQILIEGEEIETLAGHMDLSKPLAPDMELVK